MQICFNLVSDSYILIKFWGVTEIFRESFDKTINIGLNDYYLKYCIRWMQYKIMGKPPFLKKTRSLEISVGFRQTISFKFS